MKNPGAPAYLHLDTASLVDVQSPRAIKQRPRRGLLQLVLLHVLHFQITIIVNDRKKIHGR